MQPLRDFMLNNAEPKDINFFLDLARIDTVEEITDIPNSVLIPAFVMGELRKPKMGANAIAPITLEKITR